MPPRFVPTASPRCPRCSKAVYSAEQIIGPNGAAWHKSCFTCKECNRRLDSNTLAEHEGEAFCKACHKKMWGPTGYGYASGLLVREDPESQFKQSIGRPINSTGSNTGSYGNLDEVVSNTTGGSTSAGARASHQSDFESSPRLSQDRLASEQQEQEQGQREAEERERMTPVNATLKKRNSLDMIREQAEASRRAYDEAHANRVAQKYGQVNANSTGGSTTSTGSRDHFSISSSNRQHNNNGNANSGYLSTGSDTSSAFGSTIATTSSPAPSFSSISSVASSQPATRSLYLNQSLRSSSTMSTSNQQEAQDAESEYAKSRQALAFQTGAPPASSGSFVGISTPSGPPSLPKRIPEPTTVVPSSQPGSEQGDDSYLDYVPVRVVARKDDSHVFAAPASVPAPAQEPVVEDDEWDAEPAQKKPTETAPTQPIYRSQYLQQKRQEEQDQQRVLTPAPASSASTSSTRLNQLISETDKLNIREQDQRQQHSSSSAVEVDEWDEEPTPNVPSRPHNVSYMPARNVSSAATRTWTPTAITSSEGHSSNAHSRTASTETTNYSSSTTGPGILSNFNNNVTSTPKTSYYRTGSVMTPKNTASFGGGGDICPRCQKVVYHAESALAPGGTKYHKLCLRCVECSKSLDSTNMTDRQGAPYCKTCYGKAFGAKGYGYGSGASMLHTEL